MDEPGGAGNECSPPRVGRTAVETDQPIGVGKPDYDAQRRHRTASFRRNQWAVSAGRMPEHLERIAQGRMQGE